MSFFLLFFQLLSFAQESPKAIAIVVHGLNTKPASMEAIASLLKHQNIESKIVELTGHGNQMDECRNDFLDVTAEDWENDVLNVYKEVKTKNPDVPVYFVGHSLGGLVGATLVNDGQMKVDKMILLAPAIELKWFSFLMEIPLEPSLYIPSFSPQEYAANSSTVFNVYKQLLILNKQFHETQNFEKLSVPTLVLADEDDELISPAGLKKFIEKNNLKSWKYKEVKKSDDAIFHYSHLMHDENSMGKVGWKMIKDEIETFVQN